MSERNRQAEDQTEDLCIRIQGPSYVDGDETYIEVSMGKEQPRVVFTVNGDEIPVDGQWHHVVFAGDPREISSHPFDGEVIMYNRALSEDEVRAAFASTLNNWSDRELTQEEFEAINQLLANYSKIKSWELKDGILYLEVRGDAEDEERNSR